MRALEKLGFFSDNISISLFGPRGEDDNNNNNNTVRKPCFADVGSHFSCGVIATSVLAGRRWSIKNMSYLYQV